MINDNIQYSCFISAQGFFRRYIDFTVKYITRNRLQKDFLQILCYIRRKGPKWFKLSMDGSYEIEDWLGNMLFTVTSDEGRGMGRMFFLLDFVNTQFTVRLYNDQWLQHLLKWIITTYNGDLNFLVVAIGNQRTIFSAYHYAGGARVYEDFFWVYWVKCCSDAQSNFWWTGKGNHQFSDLVKCAFSTF